MALEEPAQAGFVDFHLRAADAERSVARDAAAHSTALSNASMPHAGRRHRIEVDRHLHTGRVPQGLGREQFDACRPRCDDEPATGSGGLDGVGRRITRAWPRVRPRQSLGKLASARNASREATRTVAPSRTATVRRSRRTGPVGAEHQGRGRGKVEMFAHRQHGGRRRGVRAVGVEHHRYAHRPEERFLHGLEHGLARGDVGAADEEGRVVEVVDTAQLKMAP